jgi:hypothetical protein
MPAKRPVYTREQYLEKILKEIDAAKLDGDTGVYRINEKISNDVAHYVRDYLIGNTKYRIEFRKCPSCTRTWDIMIIF